MSKESVIITEDVTVSFGDFQALKGINVDIKQFDLWFSENQTVT